MKITIVIATYNADKTLEACLASIRVQRYRDYEIVVADGVSTDRTLEILRNYASEIAIMISEKDRGIYDAWNKVVPLGTGEWFLFLGADDELWDSEVLARAAKVFESARENVIYGKVAVVLPSGEILNFEGEPWKKVGRKFRHEMTIPHQGVFHGRSLFRDHGLFDPSFKICGDYDFLLRELKEKNAKFIPDLIISRMAYGGVSSSYRNVPTIISELSRARRANGIRTPSFFIGMRWLRYFIRMAIRLIFGKNAAHFAADRYRRLVGKPELWGRFRN